MKATQLNGRKKILLFPCLVDTTQGVELLDSTYVCLISSKIGLPSILGYRL